MHTDPIIDAICHRLVREHAAHLILLYGSRANHTHTLDSDYDIAAFAPVPEIHRVTGIAGSGYLDVFVYPESKLQDFTDDLLRLRGSKVLLQRGEEAVLFLAHLEHRFLAGPAKLAAAEVQARRDWLLKMALRMRRTDAEGNFRRAWLLTSLLEDYFVLRQMWYEGPKKALAWLSVNDLAANDLFGDALVPDADHAAIDCLVRHVISDA